MQSSSLVTSFLLAVALLSACAQGAGTATGPGAHGSVGGRPIESESDYEILFWKSIMDSEDPEMYEAYLKQFPNGVYADLARLRIEKYSSRSRTKRTGFWGRFQAPGSASRGCTHDYDTLRCVPIGEGS